MYQGPLNGVFTTYGIIDPRTNLFVYIGQTSNFEGRKRAHLTIPGAGRKREVSSNSIATWLFDAIGAGVRPVIVVLAIVDTYQESLESECEWVLRLAAAKHPLLNQWKEHKDAIKLGHRGGWECHKTLPDHLRSATIARIALTLKGREEECRSPEATLAAQRNGGERNEEPIPHKKRRAAQEERGLTEKELRGRKEGTHTPENRGSAWTDENDRNLVACFENGEGARKIATHLGRTPAAVRARLVQLKKIAKRKDLHELTVSDIDPAF
ncbi:hypothetical protein [Granulicella sp. S190]|uniref:hypothetical protein n=1 Tax=Granulicella sp. S190 TaxID=1747226 RepID=UPI00131B6711|nr:hypothetical protein [Granulicella sp. S190]